MWAELTPLQEAERLACREFVELEIAPHAASFDREQRIPRELIEKLAARHYLDKDAVTYGLVTQEIGRACSSVRSIVTVHEMVSHAIARWGAKEQKSYWLPRLASGQTLAAFALTEPNVGSDARQVETTAERRGDSFVVRGEKRWITGGQLADLFLVFTQSDGQPAAILVERNTPGLTIEPIADALGTRASMLAVVRLNDCRVPARNIVGRIGFGFSHIGTVALDHGRYSVAWGCVGIIQACLDACVKYVNERRQFGSLLRDHQLIRRLISDMATNLRAARLLCLHAGRLRDAGDPAAAVETQVAKYFASRAAAQAASDAVQIHGANGCSADFPVARYYRDAKVMEIIEGSNEIQQITIAEHVYHGF